MKNEDQLCHEGSILCDKDDGRKAEKSQIIPKSGA